jgi:two-component system, OmpR family, heavy metal sensor histidine kinase CusS
MLKWLALTSGVVAVSLSATSIWFVNSSANRQIESLLLEELSEARSRFKVSEVNGTNLLQASLERSQKHPSSKFAWRVWSEAGGTLFGEFGEVSTLQAVEPQSSPVGRTVSDRGRYRWRATTLESGEVIALILDESPHRLFIDQYVLMTVLIVVAGFACTFLVGRTFSSRISGMLERIAQRVGESQESTEAPNLAMDDLPTEISKVALALEGVLLNIRGEAKSSRVLIAGMAHELRAPIQNLIGETEVTLLSDRNGERYRDVLQSHLEELRYLGDGVHNLVSLCSAKKSAEAESLEHFDLFKEARYRLEREVRRADRHKILLSFDSTGDLSMRGDREALLTGLRNLASNALDWVPPQGCVEMNFSGHGDEITVTVADNGPGIPEEFRTQIFEPFFRAPSTKGKRAGYGLGLALAHSAVVSQGGTIEVGSASLGGAEFRLSMPRVRPRVLDEVEVPIVAEPEGTDLDA